MLVAAAHQGAYEGLQTRWDDDRHPGGRLPAGVRPTATVFPPVSAAALPEQPGHSADIADYVDEPVRRIGRYVISCGPGRNTITEIACQMRDVADVYKAVVLISGGQAFTPQAA